MKISIGGFLGAALLLLFPGSVRAADVSARVSFVSGRLAVHGAQESEVSYLQRNYVVRPGDTIWTDKGGRAEIEIGSGGFLRLGESTKVECMSLGAQQDYRLWTGTAYYDGRRGLSHAAWFRTPDADCEVAPGALVRVDLGGRDHASCYAGSVRIVPSSGPAVACGRGQRVFFEGDRIDGPVGFNLAELDDFDRWDTTRVDFYAHNGRPQYLQHDIVGQYDLAGAGTWVNVRGHRYWHPRYASGWRPYSRGYWSYVPDDGYCWVDDEPWGYATSHYGRWAFYAEVGGWCWDPGYVYAPSYVRWSRYEHYAGWCPLDPWDRPVVVAGGPSVYASFRIGDVSLSFGSWTFADYDDVFYARPAYVVGGYPYFTGDRISINRTNIRNVTIVNNVYSGIGVPAYAVRGLTYGRDRSFARDVAFNVDRGIPGARLQRIRQRFGVDPARSLQVAGRRSPVEGFQSGGRKALARNAFLTGAQGQQRAKAGFAQGRALAQQGNARAAHLTRAAANRPLRKGGAIAGANGAGGKFAGANGKGGAGGKFAGANGKGGARQANGGHGLAGGGKNGGHGPGFAAKNGGKGANFAKGGGAQHAHNAGHGNARTANAGKGGGRAAHANQAKVRSAGAGHGGGRHVAVAHANRNRGGGGRQHVAHGGGGGGHPKQRTAGFRQAIRSSGGGGHARMGGGGGGRAHFGGGGGGHPHFGGGGGGGGHRMMGGGGGGGGRPHFGGGGGGGHHGGGGGGGGGGHHGGGGGGGGKRH
jgi:hypothetical protein